MGHGRQGREHREGENGERKRQEQRRPSDVPRAARGPVSLGPGLGGKQELSVGPWSPFPAPSQGYVNPLKTPLPLDLEALSSSLSALSQGGHLSPSDGEVYTVRGYHPKSGLQRAPSTSYSTLRVNHA